MAYRNEFLPSAAKDLLKHPFIRKAKKMTYLTELIERYERWQVKHGDNDCEEKDDCRTEPEHPSPGNEDLWDFGTIKPMNPMTPVRATKHALASAHTPNTSTRKRSAASDRT